MSAPGWIKLHRGLQDHWLWDCEFSYAQAWIDLLLSAGHKTTKIMIKGQIIELKRGQQARSEVTLSKKWRWSRGKVRRFLNQCLNDGMIEVDAGHLTSIITICNYDSFQGCDTSDGTSGDTPSGTPNGHLTVHKQEVKNLRSKEVSDSLSSELDDSIAAVIERLNDVTGQKLLATTKVHRDNISARLREGFTVEQLISIVEYKSAEWMGTRFQSYLKPENLFRPKNFHKNLSQAEMSGSAVKAEDLAEVYNELMTELPSVSVITTKMRGDVTEFCLKGGMDKEKFRNYLMYIRNNCTWILSGEYSVGFDYLVNIDTLLKVRGDLMNDRTAR